MLDLNRLENVQGNEESTGLATSNRLPAAFKRFHFHKGYRCSKQIIVRFT